MRTGVILVLTLVLLAAAAGAAPLEAGESATSPAVPADHGDDPGPEEALLGIVDEVVGTVDAIVPDDPPVRVLDEQATDEECGETSDGSTCTKRETRTRGVALSSENASLVLVVEEGDASGWHHDDTGEETNHTWSDERTAVRAEGDTGSPSLHAEGGAGVRDRSATQHENGTKSSSHETTVSAPIVLEGTPGPGDDASPSVTYRERRAGTGYGECALLVQGDEVVAVDCPDVILAETLDDAGRLLP